MHDALRRTRRPTSLGLVALAVMAVFAVILDACGPGEPETTPPITPGTAASPREVNIVERDYGYSPSVVDLVPGETVIIHVINGGLETHEAVIGTLADQLAYEAAEAAAEGGPPGATPAIASPVGFRGVRVVAGSGQRVDITWTVPPDAATDPGGWFVGCHLPGHWAKGMVVPVRFVGADGRPLGTPPPLPIPSPGG